MEGGKRGGMGDEADVNVLQRKFYACYMSDLDDFSTVENDGKARVIITRSRVFGR